VCVCIHIYIYIYIYIYSQYYYSILWSWDVILKISNQQGHKLHIKEEKIDSIYGSKSLTHTLIFENYYGMKKAKKPKRFRNIIKFIWH